MSNDNKTKLLRHEVKVSIVGAPGSGKSLVALVVADLLRGLGVEVTVQDPDPPERLTVQAMAILSRASEGGMSVTIEVAQLPRANRSERPLSGDQRRSSDELLMEMAEAGDRCVADGVDAMLDGVSSRGIGEMARELLEARAKLKHAEMPASFGQTKEVALNYVGAVDASDWGTREFHLGALFTREELASAAVGRSDASFLLQLAAEICTENTNGALATRVRLRRIGENAPTGPYR